MILKRNAAAVCLCFVLGCSGESFRSDADEIEYLTSISQPSVAQFHRKKELEEEDVRERERTSVESEQRWRAEERAAEDKRIAAEKAAEPARKAALEAKAQEALVEAREWEDRFVAGTPRAADRYRKLIVDFPNSPAAEVARARIKELARSQ